MFFNIVFVFLFTCSWFGLGYFILSLYDLRLWKSMKYEDYKIWTLMDTVNDVDWNTYQLHPNFIKAMFDNQHTGSDVLVGSICCMFFPIVIVIHLIIYSIGRCYTKLDGKISSLEGLKFTKEED